ncbi:ABC transporter permease subunit [Georgenia sp. SUBG003]|uniref:ABC transporter permease subunit n=1 Tax=Georgenia sp. SUBG003 TaxID=1497974 RepID=UPI003AB2F386
MPSTRRGRCGLPGVPHRRDLRADGRLRRTITGAALAEDIKKGIIDRFRSLPMSGSAVLVGRTLSDVVNNVLVLLVMGLTGLVVGWRIRTSVPEALLGFFLLDRCTATTRASTMYSYVRRIVAFWERVNFPEKLWNSFFIRVAVLAVGLSVLNAFALGIGRVKGRTWIVVLILLANMLPQEVLLYPLYFMFKEVGLYDNVWSVIIIFTVVQSASAPTCSRRSSAPSPRRCSRPPRSSASRRQILWRVVFPISRPTLAVLLIFFFIWTWNEFLIPLTLAEWPGAQCASPQASAGFRGPVQRPPRLPAQNDARSRRRDQRRHRLRGGPGR